MFIAAGDSLSSGDMQLCLRLPVKNDGVTTFLLNLSCGMHTAVDPIVKFILTISLSCFYRVRRIANRNVERGRCVKLKWFKDSSRI